MLAGEDRPPNDCCGTREQNPTLARKQSAMMIATPTTRSPRKLDAKTLWYVSDARIRTAQASERARAVVDWIESGCGPEMNPDEHTLFVALHTCAYRAARPERGKRIPAAERTAWARRWQIMREHLVQRNTGLVHSMIARHGASQADPDDLLSEGMFALSRSVQRFNPWAGYRFSTYACNAIWRALLRMRKVASRQHQRFPTQPDEVLEEPLEAEGERGDKSLRIERLNDALDRNLADLDDLEAKVLAKRFPRTGQPGLTYKEIGEAVDLSKERIRQIQNNALAKLRDVLEQDPMLQ